MAVSIKREYTQDIYADIYERAKKIAQELGLPPEEFSKSIGAALFTTSVHGFYLSQGLPLFSEVFIRTPVYLVNLPQKTAPAFASEHGIFINVPQFHLRALLFAGAQPTEPFTDFVKKFVQSGIPLVLLLHELIHYAYRHPHRTELFVEMMKKRLEQAVQEGFPLENVAAEVLNWAYDALVNELILQLANFLREKTGSEALASLIQTARSKYMEEAGLIFPEKLARDYLILKKIAELVENYPDNSLTVEDLKRLAEKAEKMVKESEIKEWTERIKTQSPEAIAADMVVFLYKIWKKLRKRAGGGGCGGGSGKPGGGTCGTGGETGELIRQILGKHPPRDVMPGEKPRGHQIGGGTQQNLPPEVVAGLTAQLLHQVVEKKAGTVPLGLEREYKRSMVSEVDWKRILRSAIKSYIESSLYKRTWTMPSLTAPGLVPGKIKVGIPGVIFIIDTSGSMSALEIGRAIDELEALLRAYKVPIYVIYYDAAAYGPYMVKNVSEIELGRVKPIGGGGTVIRPALEKALEIIRSGMPIVIFTDAEIFDIHEEKTKKLFEELATLAGRAPKLFITTFREMPQYLENLGFTQVKLILK